MAALLAATSLFLLLLLLLSGARGRQYTLNVPRVLLPTVPRSGVHSNFTLKSQHGCFKWTSTKPDVVSVQPILTSEDGKTNSHCSREALLTPQTTDTTRQSSIIIAEEKTTGQILRCDVFVDTLYRVEITTRTRELLLEEEPERFELVAYDEEGNTFSTLRGQRFEWSLLRDEEATHQTVEPEAIVHFVRFEDSSYEVDPVIRQLEWNGLHGDTVLVKGVSTGTAKVQVRPGDRVWKHVVPAVVKLLVIENILLIPAIDVYLLPLCYVDYTIERKKQGHTEVVAMPSNQYSLEVTNVTVALLDRKRSRVTALVLGDTEVVLQDKNMLHTPSATKPSAGVHVVPPHHLGYTILPDNVWVLEVGREYEISVHIYDSLNHPIMVTKNVVLETKLPSSLLLSLSSSLNGSYHTVRTIKKGSAIIHSTLTHMKHPVTGRSHAVSPVVAKDQQLEIFDPIRIEPRLVLLLWTPESVWHYTHQMEVSGGSGSYVWSCDSDAAHVTSAGLVTSVTMGKSLVIVSDRKNPAHFDTSEVHTLPPFDLLLLPTKVEVVVGSSLSLPLRVRGVVATGDGGQRSPEPFCDCRMLHLTITSSDSAVFNVSMDTTADLSSLPPSSCSLLSARALKPGHTKLTLSYSYNHTYLETSVAIAAYPPLAVLRPSNVAVLTIGSSFKFEFTGGPAPWVLDRSKYVQRLTSDSQSPVATHMLLQQPTTPGMHVYTVVCRSIGEQGLQLEVGNEPTLKNAHPAREVITARVSCALPVSIEMTPVVDLLEECPLVQSSNQNTQFPVQMGQSLELKVKVFDSERREFDNCSSLQWVWGSSDPNLLPLPPPPPAPLNYHKGSGNVLTVELSQKCGSVVLTTSSTAYQHRYLAAENIDIEPSFSPGVKCSLSLLLLPPPLLSPSHLLLYNHHSNQVTININNGSGHFFIDSSSSPSSSSSSSSKNPVALIQYSDHTHQITVSPLRDGQLTITCCDICIASTSSVVAVVMVAGIRSMRVRVSDKVEVGDSILAFVSVLDDRGLPFPSDQHRYMNIQTNPKSHHIHILDDVSTETLKSHDPETVQSNSVFRVLGVAVGHTHLMFNVTTPTGHVISSPPVPIQVFEALRLSPEYLTLLPTATFQIHSSGGPMLGAAVKFYISNSTVAMVTEDTGLIEAKQPGQATITGKAQAPDTVSGHMTTYSRDEVILTVLRLTGVRIAIATTHLLAGVEVSAYAMGVNDETPFSFVSALPGISFLWSSTNMDAVSLTSVYDKAGVSLQEEQDFAVRLRTHNPGQAYLKLGATCHAGACKPDKQVFTDEVKVEVIPPLVLVHPETGEILAPQGGQVKIVTSRDGLSVLTYRVVGDCGSGDGEGVVGVSGEGVISAGGVNGHAVVMVTASERDTGLNQTVMVHVEVATVTGLSLLPLSLVHATPTSRHHAFPLGYSAEFLATLHDAVGRPFDFADISLDCRLNRRDIVRATPGPNGTFVLKAAAKGQVIVRVRLTTNARVSDYIRVRVGYAIIPSLAVVHVGSRICFTTHLTEGNDAEWSTGDAGVVSLLPGNGVATAMSPGRAVIYHKIRGVSDTHTEITVKRVGRVAIATDERDRPPFTNAPRQRELGDYRVPVVFYHTQGSEFVTFTPLTLSPHPSCAEETGVKGGTYIQQVLFKCLLDLRDNHTPLESEKFVSVRSHFDHVTGESSCVLIPNNEHHAVEFLSTKDKLSLSLTVRAFDGVMSYDLTSSSVAMPILPAFHVGRDNITLTPSDPSTTLTVTGLPRQLQAIQVSAPHPLSITKHTSSPHQFTYLLSLTEHRPKPFSLLPLSFSSSLTKQVTTVSVSYHQSVSNRQDSGGIATETSACTTSPTPSPSPHISGGPEKSPGRAPVGGVSETWTLTLIFVVTLLAVLLGLMVMCKALRDSSPKPSRGFTAYLPQSPNPQAAFSPSVTPQTFTMTPGGQNTPPVPGSSGQSAFRRTGAMTFSPTAQSLYSQ